MNAFRILKSEVEKQPENCVLENFGWGMGDIFSRLKKRRVVFLLFWFHRELLVRIESSGKISKCQKLNRQPPTPPIFHL